MAGDGAWGGELLWVEGAQMQRLVALPGGDRAAREPWRMAAAALFQLGRGAEVMSRFPEQAGAAMVVDMLSRRLRSPLSSSMGRVFDAAAALLGVSTVAAFEGQAAMALEGLAATQPWPQARMGTWRVHDGQLDLLPLLALLADWPRQRPEQRAQGAALFHACLVAALADWVEEGARRHGLNTVACGGGCFLNALLRQHVTQALRARGLRVLHAQQVPPNDGGVSLGQAWVAQLTNL